MSRKLVIVESPNKIKSISNYLGADYDVQASIGHIRDLPQPSELPANMKKGPFGKFAVDVEGNFTPTMWLTRIRRKWWLSLSAT